MMTSWIQNITLTNTLIFLAGCATPHIVGTIWFYIDWCREESELNRDNPQQGDDQ